MRQAWNQTLFVANANGAQISNTTVETIMFPNITVPANFMSDNQALRLTAMGKFSNVVTTPGTLTFRLRWGGISGTSLALTSGIQLNIVAQTDIMFRIALEIMTRANGSSGQLLVMGVALLAQELAGNNNAPNFMGSAGGASGNTPAPVTVDLTADTALALTAQFSVATSPTNLTGMSEILESLN